MHKSKSLIFRCSKWNYTGYRNSTETTKDLCFDTDLYNDGSNYIFHISLPIYQTLLESGLQVELLNKKLSLAICN